MKQESIPAPISAANDDFSVVAPANVSRDPVVIRARQIAVQTMAQSLCAILDEPLYYVLEGYRRTLDVFEKRDTLAGQSIMQSAIMLVDTQSNLSAQAYVDSLKSVTRRPL